MTPEDALNLQIEGYRRMTGEERLLIALRLHELSCEVARSGIRWQNPTASKEEVERLLHERIALSRESGQELEKKVFREIRANIT